MQFPSPLVPATLLRRRQRFLADVRDAAGHEFTAFCPNTGRMLGYARPGMRVWLSHWPQAGSKYAWRWELGEVDDTLVAVHPARANALVAEAIAGGTIPELAGYAAPRFEVRYGDEGSRIDLLLEASGRPPCYVEVKSVTAVDEHGLGLFPDAISSRAAKHMRELTRKAVDGARAIVLFVVQREDALALRPAWEIDAAYARAFVAATSAGVEALAWRCAVNLHGIRIARRIPLLC